MGRMKEYFMEIVERDFNGDLDAYTYDQARQSCEEFIEIDDTPCPNCGSYHMERNETEAKCFTCGQEYVYIGNSLRFK